MKKQKEKQEFEKGHNMNKNVKHLWAMMMKNMTTKMKTFQDQIVLINHQGHQILTPMVLGQTEGQIVPIILDFKVEDNQLEVPVILNAIRILI